MARLLLTVAAYLASAAKPKTVVVVVSRARSGTDFLVSMLNDADEVCVKDETLRELGVDWWDQRAAAGLSEEEVERDHLLRVREKLDMVSSGDFRKPYRRRKSSPCRSDNVTASPPRGPSTRLYHRDAGARAVRGSLETRERGASARAPRRRRRAPTGSVFATDSEMLTVSPPQVTGFKWFNGQGLIYPYEDNARARRYRAQTDVFRGWLAATSARLLLLERQGLGKYVSGIVKRDKSLATHCAAGNATCVAQLNAKRITVDVDDLMKRSVTAEAKHWAEMRARAAARGIIVILRRETMRASRGAIARPRVDRVRPRRPGNRAGGRRARAAPTSTSTSPTSPRSRTRPWRASSRSSACRLGRRTRPSRRASSGPCTR